LSLVIRHSGLWEPHDKHLLGMLREIESLGTCLGLKMAVDGEFEAP